VDYINLFFHHKHFFDEGKKRRSLQAPFFTDSFMIYKGIYLIKIKLILNPGKENFVYCISASSVLYSALSHFFVLISDIDLRVKK